MAKNDRNSARTVSRKFWMSLWTPKSVKNRPLLHVYYVKTIDGTIRGCAMYCKKHCFLTPCFIRNRWRMSIIGAIHFESGVEAETKKIRIDITYNILMYNSYEPKSDGFFNGSISFSTPHFPSTDQGTATGRTSLNSLLRSRKEGHGWGSKLR